MTLGSSASVLRTVKATGADAKVGACAVATGKADSTGAVAATAIALSTKGANGCTGGFGEGGSAGSEASVASRRVVIPVAVAGVLVVTAGGVGAYATVRGPAGSYRTAVAGVRSVTRDAERDRDRRAGVVGDRGVPDRRHGRLGAGRGRRRRRGERAHWPRWTRPR